MAFDFSMFSGFFSENTTGQSLSQEMASKINASPEIFWASLLLDFESRDFTGNQAFSDLRALISDQALSIFAQDIALKQGLNAVNNPATQVFYAPTYLPGLPKTALPRGMWLSPDFISKAFSQWNAPTASFSGPVSWPEFRQYLASSLFPDRFSGQISSLQIMPGSQATLPTGSTILGFQSQSVDFPIAPGISQGPARSVFYPSSPGGNSQTPGIGQIGVWSDISSSQALGSSTYGPPFRLFGEHDLNTRIDQYLFVLCCRIFSGDSLVHAHLVSSRFMNVFGNLNQLKEASYWQTLGINALTSGQFVQTEQAIAYPDGMIVTPKDADFLNSLFNAFIVWGAKALQKWYPEAFSQEQINSQALTSAKTSVSQYARKVGGTSNLDLLLYGAGALGLVGGLLK